MAVLTALVAILGGPAPAHAADGDGLSIRLVEAPDVRRDDPRAQVYIVDHVAPGTTIKRHIEVANETASPMEVELYPGPVAITDGQWLPADVGATSEMTGWTRLGESRVELAPGASVIVPLTIGVPSDASGGERYGVVWAQTASAGGTGQVRMVSRVGIRVYLSVGPGGEPATDFAIEAMTGVRLPDGALQVRADVTNTGGRAIDLEGDLRLSDGPGSLSGGPYPARLGTTLLPGDSGQVAVDLSDDLPAGPWHALLELRSGSAKRSAEADLTFPAAGVGDRVPVDRGPFEDWRAWAAALAALAFLGLLATRVLRRRRGRDRTAAVR